MVAVQALTFGAQLKRARREAGLTQEGLAGRSGYSVTYISKLETGTRQPLATTAELLADALGLDGTARAAFHAAACANLAPVATGPALLATALPDPEPDVPAGGLAPLMGRATELAQLDALLLGQAPPVLVLAGEPGIGKTRLLREAARRAPGAGWAVLAGACQRRGGQEPFAPFVRLLADRTAQRAPAQLRAELEGCAWLARLLPELGAVIAPPEVPGGGTLAPAQERRLVFQAARRFLEQSAGPAGTLLVLDDLQWAGADALDLLAALVDAPAARPLRIVAAYRDTELRADDPLALLLSDLLRARQAVRRAVGPLAQDEAVALLEALLGALTGSFAGGGAGTRPALAERLVRRAGGVPFFLVCYAQGLGAGALDGSISASVPWDVAQAIRQRVLALPSAAQEALGVGAVIGRQVPGRLLASVATQPDQPGLDERAILAGIDAACQARLLLAVGEDHYEFAHELIRDVIRGDLGAARRAALHRRVAEAVERVPGEAPASVLAYHFGQAGELERAAHYLERAGDHALAMRAHAEALGYYQEWVERLERLEQPAEAARAREKLGMLYKDLARYTQALEVLEHAAENYRAAGDREGLLRATTQIGAAHARRGTPREGLARLEPLLAAGGTAGTSIPARATAYVALAQLYRVSGRYDEDLAAAERAAKLARTARDTRLQAWAQEHRGWALLMLSRTREAVPVLEQAVRLAEAAGDLNSLAYALNEVAILHELRGETETYREYVERALQVAEQLGDPAALALMLYNRADAAFLLGEWAAAHEDLERALAALEPTDTTQHSPWPLFGLGRLALVRGQRDDAVRLIERAIALAERGNNVELLRYAHSLLAERDLLDGDSAQAIFRLSSVLDRADHDEIQVTPFLPLYARALFEQGQEREAHDILARAIARAEAAELRPALVSALRVRALLAIRQQNWHDAEAAIERALPVARTIRDPYAEAKVLYTTGLLETARGDQALSQRAMTAALTILDQLGERLYAAHIQEALLPVRQR
ncbi:MAG TPA: AAA family ATPase [Ktedonobacterales bacterium]